MARIRPKQIQADGGVTGDALIVGEDGLYASRAIGNVLVSGHSALPQLTWSTVSEITLAAKDGQGTFVHRTLQDGKQRQFGNTLTWDITVSGEGGLGTGSEAASTWYYLYLVPDSSDDDSLNVISSTTDPGTGGPSGKDNYQYCGAVFNDSGSDLVEFKHLPNGVFDLADMVSTPAQTYAITGTPTLNTWQTLATGSSSIGGTLQDIRDIVPTKVASSVQLRAWGDTDSGDIIWFYAVSGQDLTGSPSAAALVLALEATQRQCNEFEVALHSEEMYIRFGPGSGSITLTLDVVKYTDAYLANDTPGLLSNVYGGGRSLHDTRFSPTALYQLDDLTDSSGNGYDLTEDGGTATFRQGFTTDPAWFVEGSVRLDRTGAPFRTFGAVTVMAMIRPEAFSADGFVVGCGGTSGSVEAQNMLWSLFVTSTGFLKAFQENSGGNDNGVTATEGELFAGEWVHVAMTRASDGLATKLFVNGTKVADASQANAPTGGTSSNLHLGEKGTTANPFDGSIDTVAILIGQELTEEQIQDQADFVWGRLRGSLDRTPSFTAVQTGAYTASAGQIVTVDPSGGTFTLTAPDSPQKDDIFGAKWDVIDETALTVSGNGSDIESDFGTEESSITLKGALFGRHDLTHSPVGLWQLDEDMLDSSGNSNPLTLALGTEQYGEVMPGLTGFYFDGSSDISEVTKDSVLRLTGDMTIALVLAKHAIDNDASLVIHYTPGSTEATNALYQMTTESMAWWHEYGAGNTQTFDFSPVRWSIGSPQHIVARRDSDVVSLYINGRQVGSSSGTLTTATGGSSGWLRVGHNNLDGTMASLVIYDSALTDAEINTLYRRTVGRLQNRKAFKPELAWRYDGTLWRLVSGA